jgi:hypothetical protein
MTIKGMIVYKCSVGAGTISNIISSTREESVTSSYDFDLVLPIIGVHTEVHNAGALGA